MILFPWVLVMQSISPVDVEHPPLHTFPTTAFRVTSSRFANPHNLSLLTWYIFRSRGNRSAYYWPRFQLGFLLVGTIWLVMPKLFLSCAWANWGLAIKLHDVTCDAMFILIPDIKHEVVFTTNCKFSVVFTTNGPSATSVVTACT